MEGDKIQSKKYPDADKFVEELSSESRKKTLKVVRALFNKANLMGSSEIEIPFQELSKNKVSDDDAIDALRNLHKANIAKTYLTIREIKGRNDKPGIGIIETILEDKKIFNTRARIYIKKNKIKYLKKLLEKNRLNFEDNDLSKMPLPKNKTFKDVRIKFIEDYFFEMSINDSGRKKFHGTDLGLLKTSDGKYTEKKSLTFLSELSMCNGIYPLENLTYKKRIEKTSRKRELKNTFQKIFETKEDPFFRYNENDKCIKIKIKLIPLRKLKGFDDYRDRKIYDPNIEKRNPFSDAKEFIDDSCPMI